MQFSSLARWVRKQRPPMLLSLFVLFLLVNMVAACGGSDEEVATPTAVATLEAPAPAEPTATPAPPPTATSAPAPAAAVAVTETQSVTTAASVTPTDGITVTDQITATDGVTAAGTTTETVAPRVFFSQPTANAIIPLTSTVIMGYEGLVVEPAGTVKEGAGHMHLLLDVDFVPPGEVIPNDAAHLHFGDGSLQTQLVLAPGSHTLRLQFADGEHKALEGEQYRAEIVVSAVAGAPEQAVRFAMPTDGATVPPEFGVVMAVAGLVVEPAGPVRANAGHLHILVDTDFVPPGEVIVKDETHLHFGAGQITSTIKLTPGEHILRLQFADGAHLALDGDQYRDEIKVNVVEGAAAQKVMFVQPTAGATVAPTVTVQMAAAGLIVEPAGAVLRANGGHFHILIDTDFVAPGEVIVKDETHLHFGNGQLTANVALTPGEHTLRLQMANGAHLAMEGEQYRDEIKITVQ